MVNMAFGAKRRNLVLVYCQQCKLLGASRGTLAKAALLRARTPLNTLYSSRLLQEAVLTLAAAASWTFPSYHGDLQEYWEP
eukprot:IDg1974t1